MIYEQHSVRLHVVWSTLGSVCYNNAHFCLPERHHGLCSTDTFRWYCLHEHFPSTTLLQFDALLLRRLISMSGSLARNAAMQQYGEQLGQALTAAAAVTGAGSAAARSSVVNCLSKLDTVLEIPDELKVEVRETALQVFMQQVRTVTLIAVTLLAVTL
jgi:hypothetical protein